MVIFHNNNKKIITKCTKGAKETGPVEAVRDPRVLVQTDHHSTAAETLRKTSIGLNKFIKEDRNEYYKLKRDKKHTKNYDTNTLKQVPQDSSKPVVGRVDGPPESRHEGPEKGPLQKDILQVAVSPSSDKQLGLERRHVQHEARRGEGHRSRGEEHNPPTGPCTPNSQRLELT